LGAQPQAPPEKEAPLEESEDFAGELKTEGCRVWRGLEHFGQAIAWPLAITSCS